MKNKHIKFLGDINFSTSSDIEYVENYIDEFLVENRINSINSILELYNVLQFTNTNYFVEKKLSNINEFKRIGYTFFNDYFKDKTIMSFIEEYDDIDNQFIIDFWDIFITKKVINNTDFENFAEFVTKKNVSAYVLLKEKQISEKYKVFLKHYLLSQPRYFELFVDKYDSLETSKIYLPNNFTKEEINNWGRRYCELVDANMNYLEKISKWSIHHEVKLDSEVIIKAKRANKELTKITFKDNKGTPWRFGVTLKNGLKTDFEIDESDKHTFLITFNKDWLDSDQDFPTILNNYLYFFGVFTPFSQFSLISSPYETGGFLDLLQPKSRHYYQQSFSSELGLNFSKLIFLSYFDYLASEGIDLEAVFSYYYNNLLKNEYDFPDFFFSPSSKDNTYYERCKILIPEMDSLLKQFDFIERYGEIDYEIFEIDSKNTPYNLINSLQSKKFVYFNSDEVLEMCKLLFNSQSLIAFPKNQKKEINFFDSVAIGVTMEDYHSYQRKIINSLIEKNILGIGMDSNLFFENIFLIKLYKLIWEKGYFSIINFTEDVKEVVETEVQKGNLKYGSTLFSKQESDYISFVMDNKKYSNGLCIRNKITHGSYANKKATDYKTYYLELLMILLLYTVRINEELDSFESENND